MSTQCGTIFSYTATFKPSADKPPLTVIPLRRYSKNTTIKDEPAEVSVCNCHILSVSPVYATVYQYFDEKAHSLS
jgi:hypothetical protein